MLFPIFISSDYQYGRHKVAPTIGFRSIDIILYIYRSCLEIRATQGRPYRVANGFVGAGLSVGACSSSPFRNPESVYSGFNFYLTIKKSVGAGLSSPSAHPNLFILGIGELVLFPVFIDSVYKHARLQLFISSSSLPLLLL